MSMIYQYRKPDIVLHSIAQYELKLYGWYWSDGISECVLAQFNIANGDIQLINLQEFVRIVENTIKAFEIIYISRLMYLQFQAMHCKIPLPKPNEEEYCL